MRGNPIAYRSVLSPDFIRRAAHSRQRRDRLQGVVMAAGTAVALAGLLAIPLFLLARLPSLDMWSAATWNGLGVLASGTVRAATCAVMVAVPLGIATAMFTAHFCAPRLRAWIRPALEVLEALPTVVLGLVAAVTIAPWLKGHVASVLALVVVLPAAALAAGMLFGGRFRNTGWLPLWLLPLLVAVAAAGIAIADRRADASVAVVPSSPWNAMLVGLALGVAALPLVFSVAEDALMLVPREQADANEYSDMLGYKTLRRQQRSTSHGGGGRQVSTNHTEERRALMLPQEVKELPADEELIFYEGCKPIRARKNWFFKDRTFKARSSLPAVEVRPQGEPQGMAEKPDAVKPRQGRALACLAAGSVQKARRALEQTHEATE